MESVAIIMAGGSGERFWPLSRQQRPKQLLQLTPSGRTLVEEAVERLSGVVPAENVYVLTSPALQALLRRKLPQVRPAHVVAEPVRRNTAACLVLAAALIVERFGEADKILMAAFPSDHVVEPVEEFQRTLRVALAYAAQGEYLFTIGIVPTRPETGYGYMELGEELGSTDGVVAYRVRRFREKPSREVAEEFLRSGRFLWNSGMFFWRVDLFIEALRRHMPAFWSQWEALRKAVRPWVEQPVEGPYPELQAIFEQLPDVSIDYALAERVERLATVRASFRWDDLGAWDALERIFPTDSRGNVVIGEVILQDSEGCIVLDARAHPQAVVTLVGLRECVVVLTDDALLCCAKSHVQQVRHTVAYLREHGYEAVL